MPLTLLRPVTFGCFGLVLILSASFSAGVSATVYEWRSPNGDRHFSNDVATVPEDKREAARTFTSRFAGIQTPAAPSPAPANHTQDSAALQTSTAQAHIAAYERGLERGLQTAERQVRMAAELARTVLAAAPRRPPTQIIIRQSAPQVRHIYSHAPAPFYGFIGPYSHYGSSYFSHRSYPHRSHAYGFRRGRFISHSHLSPSRHRRPRGIFFPRGHQSKERFLFGHGFVLR
jgi:hypothetical protein